MTISYLLVQRRKLLHNLPGKAHSLLFGHMPTLAKETLKFSPDAHNQILMNHVTDTYNLRRYGLFYVNTYPIQHKSLLIVISPEIVTQVTQIDSYPKHLALNRGFGQAIRKRRIVVQENADWKELRTMFNPRFS
ncbi:hypothetical protein F5884DRAFT_429653 [Xylogone sp. PMI_703]|nr:hypothetical protein F5884DRAFT_429653 [Xylogone sp. PMI_703]